jgi:hypothetical protein
VAAGVLVGVVADDPSAIARDSKATAPAAIAIQPAVDELNRYPP